MGILMDISALSEFYRGFYIDTPRSNNAFSYSQRSIKRIYVPPLIKGSLEDVKVGDEIVFCDIIDAPHVAAASGHPAESQAKGLKHFVHMERPGQNIFIFDNHNHAFSFWAAGVFQGVIPEGTDLVHVDQHKDTRMPEHYFHMRVGAASGRPGVADDINQACRYANDVLNVGNFIPPALEAGWFKDVVQVGSAEAFSVDIRGPFVLDIDLDIFAPVMDYIPDEVKLSRLREWVAQASFITMATSPFFIDQNRALHYLRCLL